MAARQQIKFTYQDYLQFPDDGKTYQIIEGELHMTPAPVPYHQSISRNLEHILWGFVRKKDLGKVYYAPCDIVFSEENVVQPDIFFISKEREHIIGEKYIHEAPDLIIEILSPRTKELDQKLKAKLYETFGVKEYWLVDPEKKEIEVLTLTQEGYSSFGVFTESLSSPILKGLTVGLSEVFQG